MMLKYTVDTELNANNPRHQLQLEPAPLTSVPIVKPWQIIAVDILEVPVSHMCLLVIQDYFTKWADAIPLRDQTALRLHLSMGSPDLKFRTLCILIKVETLKAACYNRYLKLLEHSKPEPQPIILKGMVWLKSLTVHSYNFSVHSYVEETGTEQFLPLVLHAYLTSVHSSTRVSPFVLMFGREPKHPNFGAPGTAAHDPTSCVKWRSYEILLKPTLFIQLLNNRHSTTSIPSIANSRLVIVFGYPSLWLENLIQF